NLTFCKLCRKNGCNSLCFCFLVYFSVEILVISWSVSNTSTNPDRASCRSVSCAASSLLFPWLLSSSANFSSSLCVSVGDSCCALKRRYNLVHEVCIPFHAEHILRKREF